MWSPRQATKAAKAGEPLPQLGALGGLYAEGHNFHKGDVIMVAGLPGSAKTMFMLWAAEQFGVSALYLSCDSDAATMTSRLGAMLTGYPASKVRDEMTSDDQARDYYGDVMSTSQLTFCFDSNPSVADIEDELSAYVELHDRFPDVVIVDNLMDVFAGGESELSGHKFVLIELKRLARETGAAVFVLHHARETGAQTDMPSPRDEVAQKVSQTPAMMLTVARSDDRFHIAVVKSRHSAFDPSGQRFTTLAADLARCQFQPYGSVADRARQIEHEMSGYGSRTA